MNDMKQDMATGLLPLCMLGVLCAGIAPWALNVSVYAYAGGYVPISREIDTLCGGLLCLVIMLVSRYKPALLDGKIMLIAGLGCLVTNVIVLNIAMRMQDPLFTTLGLVFGQAGRIIMGFFLCCAMCSLSSLKSVICASTMGALAAEIITFCAPTPSTAVGGMLIAACSLVTGVATYAAGRGVRRAVAAAPSASALEIVNPESFLKPSHPLYLCAFLFSVGGGYAIAFNQVRNVPSISIFTSIALLVVCAVMMRGESVQKADGLFSYAVLMMIIGFAAVPLFSPDSAFTPNMFLRMGTQAFAILIWLVAASTAQRNVFAFLPLYYLVQTVEYLGTDLGAVVGHWSNGLAGSNMHEVAVIATIALVVFVSFVWVGFRRFSFVDTVKGMVGMNPPVDPGVRSDTADDNAESLSTVGQDDHGDRIDVCCRKLSVDAGLTDRESEIFALLAHGRNGHYIMDRYVISRNTAKTHIKHIYQKLGVHSQQELIDLVEAAQPSV